MKKVIVTIRLAVKTDPTDKFQIAQDTAELLQEIIEEGTLEEVIDLDQDEDEEELDEEEYD